MPQKSQISLSKEKLIQMEEHEHIRYHRRIFYVFTLIIILLAIGGIFYHNIEGWRYLDAVYFSTYTITTVGYGEFVPKTDIGKIFTIFYIFTGVSIVLYGLSLMASHFVEVREEAWLERINRIKITKPKGIERFKNFFRSLSFDSEKLVKEYEDLEKRK
ncbi:MAG: potassium channel family protein [Nanoarchaeota archaeon]